MTSLADVGPINPFLNLLLYGPPGGGKTVFAHQFPGGSRTLDFDDGMQSVLWAIKEGLIAKEPSEIIFKTFHAPRNPRKEDLIFDLASMQIDTWLEEEEKGDAPSWNTLIIDSGTLLTQHSIIKGLKEAARLNTSQSWTSLSADGIYAMRQADWGAASQLFTKFVQFCLSLEKNVMLLCHEYSETSESGAVTSVTPKLIGQLRQDIPLYFDECYYMTVAGNKDKVQYKIQTKRDAKHQCKSRLGCFDALEDCDFETLRKKVADFYEVDLESVWNPSYVGA